MPIPAQPTEIGYTGNGAATSYAYPFRLFAAADLVVFVAGEVKPLNVDYTLTGVNNPSGGTVEFTVAPGSGAAITLQRNTPVDRITDYTTAGPLRAETLDDDLDRAAAQRQDLHRRMGQAEGDIDVLEDRATALEDTIPDPAPGKGLRWKDDGSGLENTEIDLQNINTLTTAAQTAADQSSASATSAGNSATSAAVSATTATTKAAESAANAAAAIAAQANGFIGFATKATMDSNLNYSDGVVAWVTNDATAANNGVYRKSGASGSGSWVQSSFDRVAAVETKQAILEAVAAGTTTGKNLFNKDTGTSGYYINYLTGGLNPSGTYNASDYIPVSSSTAYYMRHAQQMAFYDAGRAYISGLASAGAFTTPANAKFVRVSTANTNLGTQQVELGSAYTSYEAHERKLASNLTIAVAQVAGLQADFDAMASLQAVVGSQDYMFAGTTTGKNLFDKGNVTVGYYISYSTGTLAPAGTYNASDYIPVSPNTAYFMRHAQQLAFYDVGRAYISGLASAGAFTTPANAKFVRVSTANTNLDSQQVELGSAYTTYEAYERRLVPEVKVSGPAFKILLPSKIYLVSGQSFSVYFRNIIKYSGAMQSGDYYVRAQMVAAGVYSKKGVGYPYKWEYTPTGAEQFDVEFRVVSTYSGTVMAAKIVTFVAADAANAANHGRSATIVTIGDSFTDLYNLSKYLHEFTTDNGGGNTLNHIGLNNGGLTGVVDDAWSGYGYTWYTTSATGFLRSDRPLEHAVWDAGWGENEVNGWTTGQTHSDLTTEQKSHGFTRNQFWNPSTGQFDFAYYMATYFPGYTPSGEAGSHVDALVSFAGLNDAIWDTVPAQITALPGLSAKILSIIDSVQAWDPQIKIFLHTVTPQPDNDKMMSDHGANFTSSTRAKFNQELWNEMILTGFDSPAMQARGVYVVPTAAHFDTRSAILTSTYYPDKFDPAYAETLTSDVHPTAAGAKYIADAMWMALYNLAF